MRFAGESTTKLTSSITVLKSDLSNKSSHFSILSRKNDSATHKSSALVFLTYRSQCEGFPSELNGTAYSNQSGFNSVFELSQFSIKHLKQVSIDKAHKFIKHAENLPIIWNNCVENVSVIKHTPR